MDLMQLATQLFTQYLGSAGKNLDAGGVQSALGQVYGRQCGNIWSIFDLKCRITKWSCFSLYLFFVLGSNPHSSHVCVVRTPCVFLGSPMLPFNSNILIILAV